MARSPTLLNGFSAHADQKDLIHYAQRVHEKGHLKQIALVHGDIRPQRILAELLTAKGRQIVIPAPGDKLTID